MELSGTQENTVTAAFATSSQVVQEEYDIFISFRGSDIRPGFLSHLKEQLRKDGVDVYVDERIKRGDDISSSLLGAIERSKIALVIFSKDYASSPWCLKELVKIMDCKRDNRQIVIPLFYNVDPSHVRHQKRSYADAFTQHEQKFKDDIWQVWRSVLEKTANLSGHTYSSNFQDEFDLINRIVKDVLKNLEDKDTIKPKLELIGFEENLATIESLLKVDSQEVGVIGIWGKGGAGKTTLARVVFDKFSKQFDSSCFVNVREKSKRIGLTCLLEEILSVLLKVEYHTMKGRSNTQRRLSRKSVLLVLDNVDTYSQLQYLIEENLSLGPLSKVIITSRDKDVLVSGEAHAIHEVIDLNMEESRQLFCWHAFKQRYPKAGYEKLSAQAVQYATGLPLALKVVGSYLKSKNTKTSWESALKKLRKYPHAEIQNVLRVSYDGLDIPQKWIFLDIAFFFRGQKKEDIISVLNACDDLDTDFEIDNLLDKALITISEDNRVEIHDLLQEMAEEIVREESREDPARRSRLNDPKEIRDVLLSMGTEKIQGITVDVAQIKEVQLRADTFTKMKNLRIIQFYSSCEGHTESHIMLSHDLKPFPSRLKYSSCEGHTESHIMLPHDLKPFPSRLKYFRWDLFPSESLPLGFCPENLVDLQMPHSNVKKLWDGVQGLPKLEIINLSFCRQLLELPDFSNASKLQRVNLKFCENLRRVHPSVFSDTLVGLDVSYCSRLESLESETHLESLSYLAADACSLKRFCLSLGKVEELNLSLTQIEILHLPTSGQLRFLHLDGSRLRSLPINEFQRFKNLECFRLDEFHQMIHKTELDILFAAWRCLSVLRLKNCSKLLEIPENISTLPKLYSLSLEGSNVEILPACIQHLSNLRQFHLKQCRMLRSIPGIPLTLNGFSATGCTSLETISCSSELQHELLDHRCDLRFTVVQSWMIRHLS